LPPLIRLPSSILVACFWREIRGCVPIAPTISVELPFPSPIDRASCAVIVRKASKKTNHPGGLVKRLPWLGISQGILMLALAIGGCARQDSSQKAAQTPAGNARPAIVFMTDFGTANDAVAICKAVMLGIAPDARILDITHQVTPFSIEEGARFLAGASPYYPAGTVFVVVIDPGVGTSRK